MIYSLLVLSSPISGHTSRSAADFARCVIARGHSIHRVFFLDAGTLTGSANSVFPQDETNPSQLWTEIATDHAIELAICITSALRHGMLDAEEAGISTDNVDQVRQLSRDPAVRRLLGLDKNTGESLGLQKDWAYNIIKQVGNYADSFNRNVGKASPLKVKRGLNALWRDGGLHYAPPID